MYFSSLHITIARRAMALALTPLFFVTLPSCNGNDDTVASHTRYTSAAASGEQQQEGGDALGRTSDQGDKQTGQSAENGSEASVGDGGEISKDSSSTTDPNTRTFTVTGKLTNAPIRMMWLMDDDRNLRKYEEKITLGLNDLVNSTKNTFPSADLKTILVSHVHHENKQQKVTQLSQHIVLNPQRFTGLGIIYQLIDSSRYPHAPYSTYFEDDEDSINIIVSITRHNFRRGTTQFISFLGRKFDDTSSFRFYGFIDKEHDIQRSGSSSGSYSDLAKKLKGQIFDVLRYNGQDRQGETRNEASEWDAAFATLKSNLADFVEQPVNEFEVGDVDVDKVTLNGKGLYPEDFQYNGDAVKILAPLTKGDKVVIRFQ